MDPYDTKKPYLHPKLKFHFLQSWWNLLSLTEHFLHNLECHWRKKRRLDFFENNFTFHICEAVMSGMRVISTLCKTLLLELKHSHWHFFLSLFLLDTYTRHIKTASPSRFSLPHFLRLDFIHYQLIRIIQHVYFIWNIQIRTLTPKNLNKEVIMTTVNTILNIQCVRYIGHIFFSPTRIN